MKHYEVKIKFIRAVLGSQPANSEIKETYILKKIITGRTGVGADIAIEKIKEEIENLKKDPLYVDKIKEIQEKNLNVFYRNTEGKPSVSDIQVRGFMKEAFAFVGRQEKWLTKKSGEAYATDDYFKRWFNERIGFADQYFTLSGEITIFDRPQRTMTMQGPRVSIASSERIEAPQEIKVRFTTTDDVKREWLDAVFDRGMFKGISQWANAQWGTFTYELMELHTGPERRGA